MKNELLTKGIILPSGEIGKNKINLVAGAITQPFAEMVWVTTGGDMETINRLTNVLVTMNNPTDRGKLFKIIKLLYGANGLAFFRGSRAYGRRPRRFGILHLFFHGRLWRSHARTDSRRNEIATRTAAFLTLSLGEQERRYFYALMLRSRGKKSLDLSGLQNAKQRKQGKDTLPLKIRVLLRNKSKAKE